MGKTGTALAVIGVALMAAVAGRMLATSELPPDVVWRLEPVDSPPTDAPDAAWRVPRASSDGATIAGDWSFFNAPGGPHSDGAYHLHRGDDCVRFEPTGEERPDPDGVWRAYRQD